MMQLLDMSRVELTITYGVLKKNYDIAGKMENYVRVRVLGAAGGTSEYKTKIAEGEKNAKIIWNETISIPLRPAPQVFFEFTLLDEDTTTDDVCGVGLLNLNACGVFAGGPNKYNIRLHGEENQEISGELHVTTRFL
jgi:Ca2+-dependent lipid-binding protein